MLALLILITSFVASQIIFAEGALLERVTFRALIIYSFLALIFVAGVSAVLLNSGYLLIVFVTFIGTALTRKFQMKLKKLR